MVTLQWIAEHRLSIVFYYQSFTLSPCKRSELFIEIWHKKILPTRILSTLGCLLLWHSVTLWSINPQLSQQPAMDWAEMCYSCHGRKLNWLLPSFLLDAFGLTAMDKPVFFLKSLFSLDKQNKQTKVEKRIHFSGQPLSILTTKQMTICILMKRKRKFANYTV